MESTNKELQASTLRPRYDKGIWTTEEHEKMINFLFEHKDRIEEHVSNIINNRYRSNKSHFFQLMANHIETKTISQCKSRYQKRELEMLSAIGIPSKAIRSYFLFKKLKNPYNKQKIQSDSNSIINFKVKEESEQTCDPNAINNSADLKNVLKNEILPRVINPIIKGDVQVFIDHLDVNNQSDKFVPLINVTSIQQILNKHGIFQLKKTLAETL